MAIQSNNSTEQILAGCKKGNRLAQQELFCHLLPYLKAICLRYLRNATFVDDAIQESFVKIFSSINSYNEKKGSLHSWSAQIAIRTCINLNERIIKQPTENMNNNLSLSNSDYEQHTFRLSLNEVLITLQKMPYKYYAVFNMYVIEGYSHKEISSILEISPALSRKRLMQSREWVDINIKNKNILKLNTFVKG